MFEDVLDKYKDDLTKSLVACGEAHRVHKILSDIEMNREDYLYFYNEGLKVNQDRLDDNQEKLDKVTAIIHKHTDAVPCSHLMSPFKLGVLTVASEIEELLK